MVYGESLISGGDPKVAAGISLYFFFFIPVIWDIGTTAPHWVRDLIHHLKRIK